MRLTKVMLVSLILMASFIPSVYGLTAFTDGFEAAGAEWDDKWDGNGATTWTQGQAGEGEPAHSPHGGSNDAWCDPAGTLLTSDDINLLGASTASLTFWYYLDDTEAADIILYLYDGATYDTIASIGGGAESTWLQYTIDPLDSQYFISNFRIRFDGTGCGTGENVFVDDVLVSYSTTSEYNRAASQSMTWASSVSKASIFGRAASQSLGWSSTTSRILEFGRAASQSLAWGSTVAKILDYGRTAIQGLTLGSTVTRALDYGRVVAQTLTWASSITRGIDLTRLATQNIVLVSEAARLIEVTRDAAQSIITSWDALGGMAGIYNAVVDLMLYVKVQYTPLGGGDPPVGPNSGSGLFIVAIVFLTMAMAMKTRPR